MMKTRRSGAFFACAGIALSLGALSASGADPLEAYLVSIRLDALLAKGLTGEGINIGQMEVDRPNVSHVSLVGQDVTIWGSSPAAPDSHETGVASLILGKRTAAGGNFQGVATKGSLWMSGFGGTASIANIKSALDWQLNEPATTVVNNSWGLDWNKRTEAARNQVRGLFDWAVTQGQLHVCAAGNEGQDAGTGTNKTGNLTNPGYAYNVLTVGNCGPAGNWNQVSVRSSVTQADATGNPTARLKVDIVAPGTGIKLAWGPGNSAFSTQSGTSFATPITTGVVALLQQHGNNKGFSTDPRLMRAVIMNSANKTVQNRDGVRWDKQFETNANGVAATRTSNETGAGKLDAMEAYTQYDAGQQRATVKQGSATHQGQVKATGWDVDTVAGKGANNGNDYLTQDNLRKGTYLTSTLIWNRDVNSSDADPTKWTYRDLAGMNLAVARSGSVGTKVSLSNFGETVGGGENETLKGTSQHNVYKTGARDRYWISAYLRTTSPIANTTYALAWRGYAMETSRVEAFNGGFDGDRGAYRDNGWYSIANTVTAPTVVREAWMPGNENNWAMCLQGVPNLDDASGFAQELVKPLTFFRISFDLTFDMNNPDSYIQIFLGGINVLQSFGGVLKSDSGLAKSFTRWTFELNQAQLAGMAFDGNFTELTIEYRSSDFNLAYLDNIEYIPSAPTFALFAMLGAATSRRRRN